MMSGIDEFAILNLAYDMGVSLGLSDEALENHPTFDQVKAARVAIICRHGTDCLSFHKASVRLPRSFDDGYIYGKADVQGARRRVAIKRQARYIAAQQLGGTTHEGAA